MTSVDITVERSDKQVRVKSLTDIAADEKIVDMGPDSLATIAPLIAEANFILWNGPTGWYEGGYAHWTVAIAELIEKRVAAGAQVVIGGGDTIAAIEAGGVSLANLGFISTGGGAMLEYILQGTLPGIAALE